MSNYIDEEKIRRRVIKRMEERQGLLIHAAAYIVVNVILWTLFLGSGVSFPWPMFVTGFWGIGMFAHAAEYWNEYGGGATRRERTIQREIERERQRLGLSEDEFYGKPKNDRLADDGELFYDEDGYHQDQSRR